MITRLAPKVPPRKAGWRHIDVETFAEGSLVTMAAPAGSERTIVLDDHSALELAVALIERLGAASVAGAKLLVDATELIPLTDGRWVDGQPLPLAGGRCPECGWSCCTEHTAASVTRHAIGGVEVSFAPTLHERVVEVTLGDRTATVTRPDRWVVCDQCGARWAFDGSVPLIEAEATKEGCT